MVTPKSPSSSDQPYNVFGVPLFPCHTISKFVNHASIRHHTENLYFSMFCLDILCSKFNWFWAPLASKALNK